MGEKEIEGEGEVVQVILAQNALEDEDRIKPGLQNSRILLFQHHGCETQVGKRN